MPKSTPSPHQLAALRRTVRRDPNVSDGAARLFAEIIDLHMLKGGCFAEDTRLGAWIGCTERTVRRRRKQLKDAGYLREEHGGGRRYLVPVADADNPDRTAVTDASVRSDSSDGQQRPSNASAPDNSVRDPDTSVREAPDNSVRDRELIIPAEAREGARPREAPVRESDPPGVKAYVEVLGKRPTPYEHDRIRAAVTGGKGSLQVKAFRKACQKAVDNLDGDAGRVRLGYLLDSYEREVERRREKQKRKKRHRGPSGDGIPSGMADFAKLARQLDGREPIESDLLDEGGAHARA